MDDYLYIVWFRDLGADPSEQDHEWPAAFLIEAASAAEAKQWGDTLAARRCARLPSETVLRSTVERRQAGPGGEAGLPRIRYGECASNDALGW